MCSCLKMSQITTFKQTTRSIWEMRMATMTAMMWALIRLLVRLLGNSRCNRHISSDVCKTSILLVWTISRSHFLVPRWRGIMRLHQRRILGPQIFAMLAFKERLIDIDMQIWTMALTSYLTKIWTLFLLPILHFWWTIMKLVWIIEIIHIPQAYTVNMKLNAVSLLCSTWWPVYLRMVTASQSAKWRDDPARFAVNTRCMAS